MRAIAHHQRLLHLKLQPRRPPQSLRLRVSTRLQAYTLNVQQYHTRQQPQWRPLPTRIPAPSTSLIRTRHFSQAPIRAQPESAQGQSSILNSTSPVTSIYQVTNPSQADPSDLISNLPKISVDYHTNPTQALFLITPQLPHWFEPGSSTLALAVSRIFSKLKGDALPTVYVAIVDALPGAEYFADDTWDANDDARPHAPVEGVAMCISSDVWAQRLGVGTEQGRALVQVISRAEGSTANTTDSSEGMSMRTVLSIPAANTLFVNGRESTMFGTKWKPSQNGDAFEMDGDPFVLSSVGLVLDRSPRELVDVYVPLFELTKARKVLSSMGNVVREVEGDDGKTLKASTELEAVVPKFLARLKEEGDEAPIQVFARVEPGSANAVSRLQSTAEQGSLQNASTKVILDDLWQGCQVFRVTSGGGGWGKKAGLLSLDPATSFDPPKSSKPSIFPDPDADELSFGSLADLGALVPTGHTIQFFAAKVQEALSSSSNDSSPLPTQESSKETNDPRTQKWLFGNFSTAEADQEFAVPQHSGHSSIKVLPGCFGAISHGGSAIALHKSVGDGAAADADADTAFQYAPLNEFKIDAPFATYKTTTRST